MGVDRNLMEMRGLLRLGCCLVGDGVLGDRVGIGWIGVRGDMTLLFLDLLLLLFISLLNLFEIIYCYYICVPITLSQYYIN
jgi:hypothetical protein